MLPESASNINVSRDSQSYHRSKTARLSTTHVYLSSSCPGYAEETNHTPRPRFCLSCMQRCVPFLVGQLDQ